MIFLQKHVVIIEFIEKNDGRYYPVDSVYEGSPLRCSELQKLGYLGDEIKKQKGSNGSSESKQLAAEAGEKNEPRKNEQKDNPPARTEG